MTLLRKKQENISISMSNKKNKAPRKKSKPTFYKRGKVEISGDSRTARYLMLIDMISTKLFWVLVFVASFFFGYQTSVLATFLYIIAALIRGG
jgi:hypothetical protein